MVELRRDVNPSVVLNLLFKHTQLQDTFGVINLALVNGEPKVLNLYDLLNYYLIHQKDVVTRRTKFDLDKAEARAHIVGSHYCPGQHRRGNKHYPLKPDHAAGKDQIDGEIWPD